MKLIVIKDLMSHLYSFRIIIDVLFEFCTVFKMTNNVDFNDKMCIIY